MDDHSSSARVQFSNDQGEGSSSGLAHKYLSDLLSASPERIAGTEGILAARNWLERVLSDSGLRPTLEEFSFPKRNRFQLFTMALNASATALVAAFSPTVGPYWGFGLIVLLNIVDFGLAPRLASLSRRASGTNVLTGISRDWAELGADSRPVVLVTAHYDSADSQSEWYRALSERMDLWLGLGLIGLLLTSTYWILELLQLIPWIAISAPLWWPSISLGWNVAGRWIATLLLLPSALTTLSGLVSSYSRSADANPGADDNGSGVAVTLAACDAIRRNLPKHIDVGAVFLSAEEAGLYGSRFFSRKHKERFDPTRTTILCLDGVGRGDTAGTVEGQGLLKRWVVERSTLDLWETAVRSVTPNFIRMWYSVFTGSTDQLAWLELGFSRTLSISHGRVVRHPFKAILHRLFGVSQDHAEFDFSHLHSARDDLSSINPNALITTTEAVTRFVEMLDNDL